MRVFKIHKIINVITIVPMILPMVLLIQILILGAMIVVMV